jgi:hypothetical protein
MSTRIYRRQIPIFVVSFFMAVLLIDYYAPKLPIISPVSSTFLAWGAMIALIQLSFGYLTLLRMHVERASRAQSEGFNQRTFKTIIVLATFVIMTVIGIYEGRGNAGPSFLFWYSNLVAMAGVGTVLEWISHYSSPARMFKITSLESGAMFLTWLLVCFREMPTVVVLFPFTESIGDWIMKTPYMASNRGVMIAAGIGIVILAVRALVGKEPGLVEMEVTK